MENPVNRRSLLALTAGAAATPFLARPGFAQVATITGAGATFPRPVYERWGQAAREGAGIILNYQSIGSGGGINQITNRTVDFGATDAPLSPAQLTERNLGIAQTAVSTVGSHAAATGCKAPLTPKAEQIELRKKKPKNRPNVLATPTMGLTRPPTTANGIATAMTTKQMAGLDRIEW
jgi:hypothetical protein